MVVEPAVLTVSREYEVPWKKQTFYNAELARLRFEEKLNIRQIAERLGAPKTTVYMAIQRLGKERERK